MFNYQRNCIILNYKTLFAACKRYRCLSANPTVKYKWDLMSAICIERHPIISPPKSEIEEAYQKVLYEIEIENSMKSDHELKIEVEKKERANLKKGLIELDTQKVLAQKAEELEDIGEAELAEFKFAPRITEADKNNITTSLDRKLDKNLLLLIQQKIGDDLFWLPPQGIRKENETMRETADRILLNMCGDKFVAKIYGNAPIGFYKWVYPKNLREEGTRGAKVFYYLAKYMNGDIADKVKYQWLDRLEVEQTIPPRVYKSVSQFLIPEETY